MVATSIAAANGDLGGFTRLIAEATDPPRLEAMRGALGFLQKNFAPWMKPTSPPHQPGSTTTEPWSIEPGLTS